MSDASRDLCGLVLAAGAGTRFGGPKALARMSDGTPWIARAVGTLRDAGCRRIVVTLGAGVDEARSLVPADAEIVFVADWAAGLSASLRAGLIAAEAAEAAVILPVDTPATPVAAVRRVVEASPDLMIALVQAVYRGAPGHPVLIGSAHFATLASGISGDVGARPYLRAHGALEVECADLWSGADMDTRP
ncbi:NTP transferase domain-containing protein [Microbacterium sp. B2969]|uniref:NTP transferase domain-containing protein n=1 Tax=Microbacterium alkaliflavum TaxID=3248839 RepID=A0ABW7Q9W8_9MICO